MDVEKRFSAFVRAKGDDVYSKVAARNIIKRLLGMRSGGTPMADGVLDVIRAYGNGQ